MENPKAETKNLKAKFVDKFVFYILVVTFCLTSVCGCRESLQLQTTTLAPAAASISSLTPQAMQIIQQALADESPYIQVNAIETIAITKQAGLMPKVQRLLGSDYIPVRFAGALSIGDMEYRFAEDSIRQLLKDKDTNVRIAAAYAMYKLGHKEYLSAISKAVTTTDQVVRANAALLLGKSGDQSTIKVLYWILSDKNSDDRVRFQAADAIAMLGDEEILPKLWAVVLSTYADDRIVGLRSMGALGTKKARDVLITKLDDDVLEVRLVAAEQLGMLGYNTGEAQVLDVFRKNLTAGLDQQARGRVNVFTAMAIGQIGSEPLTKYLPQLLQDQSKLVRLAAAKAVLQCVMKSRSEL